MSEVKWMVRTEGCADHPGEEWLKLTVDGEVLMETCTGTIQAYAEHLRGREMIQIQCRDYDHRKGVSLRVRLHSCCHHATEWLTLYENGVVLFDGCVTLLDALARANRGRDLVALLSTPRHEKAPAEDQQHRYAINPHV